MEFPDLVKLNSIEEKYEINCLPALGDAYKFLINRWKNDVRDRETILRLYFLSWYAHAEPWTMTGLGYRSTGETWPIFIEIYEMFGGLKSNDQEFVFISMIMLTVFPFAQFGGDYDCLGGKFKDIYKLIESVDETLFLNRGTYGDYFLNQLQCQSRK